MSRLRILPYAVLSMLLYGGCSRQDEEPVAPSVITITLTPASPVLHVGETLSLGAEVKGASGPATLDWSSGDEKVATVNGIGRVKGMAAGRVLITVKLAPNSAIMGAVTVTVQ